MAITTGLMRQAAVIAWRNGQVCLVTSRSGKRWVVPKGCMEPGMTAGEIALQEAWEEAGLAGLLRPDPLGSYTYEKEGLTCYVVVFYMTVTEVADSYPEVGLRERVWVSAAQATGRVEEPGLRELIRSAALARVG